jgi:hypothetical protein
LKNYPSCAQRYKLSRIHTPRNKPKTESDFLKGNLFEYWATGASSDPIIGSLAEKWETSKAGCKIGNLKKPTIEKVYNAAQSAKKAFKKILFANDEFIIPLGKTGWFLEFHPDIIGEIFLPENDFAIPAIVDTKYTGSINEVWNNKDSKMEFLQAMVYIYGFYYFSKDKMPEPMLLPFVYQITEHNAFQEPFHKYIIIHGKPQDFIWFENLIKTVIEDNEMKPNPGEGNCLGKGNPNGPCRYLEFCEEGRALVNRTESYQFNDLR